MEHRSVYKSLQLVPAQHTLFQSTLSHPVVYMMVFQVISLRLVFSPPKSVHIFLLPHTWHILHAFILIDMIFWIIFGDEYKSLKLLIM